MKLMNQHWRGICRIFGVLLLGTGLFFAYHWFYYFAPSRRIMDPHWFTNHSQREYWKELQSSIQRGLWEHDEAWYVGQYGDKSWAKWIMEHSSGQMACMGGKPCHGAVAMRYLSNQDVGEEADAWHEWWKTNQSKSQEEWLADGFRQRGYMIDIPPKPEQFIVLLNVLGNIETNRPNAISKEMKYNAFRCLRDSGFDPVAYILSNRTVSAIGERGLLEYEKHQRRWPSAIGVGLLPFAKRPFGSKEADYNDTFVLPPFMQTSFKNWVYALIWSPLALGVGLIGWSFRKCRVASNGKKYDEPTA